VANKILLLRILPAQAFSQSEEEYLDMSLTALFLGITASSQLNLLEFQRFMHFVSREVLLLERFGTDSAHVTASSVLLDRSTNA